ncbi:MAG: alpha/beta hydrolase [Myxococcales bacterium]|nr:alpha/beta hydrolase [Myxococcales bacterium]
MDWTTRQVRANELSFTVREMGEGPLALLAHGFPDTPHGFDELGRSLAEAGHRVVAPFMRGYHPTEAPERDASVDDLADDLLALASVLGHDRIAVLVGHDWGAAAVCAAAGVAPDRVQALVAIGMPHPATIRPSLRLLWAGRHFIGLRMPWAARWMRRGGVDRLVHRWSPTWAFGPEETAPVKASFDHPQSLHAAIGYYRGGAPGRLVRGFRPKISVPTLAVAGADDPGVTPDDYEHARRKFAGPYDVVVLPGGHFVHRESPAATRDAVLSFLESAA